MTKDKGNADQTGQETAPDRGRGEAGADPMKSFDPQGGAEGAPGATPAERTRVGNGSARTMPEGAPTAPGAQAEGTADTEPPAGDGETSALEAQLEQARLDGAAHYDRFVRLQAEFENYKKRIHKEHQDSLRFAVTPLVAEMATVLDNLERAVDHARKEPENGAAGLLEGIEMVLRQLQDTLGRFGVTRIEAVGKPFDPALHEAMTVVETNDVPENHVMHEFQAGYLLHDRVIRPARVSVAKRAADGSATPA